MDLASHRIAWKCRATAMFVSAGIWILSSCTSSLDLQKTTTSTGHADTNTSDGATPTSSSSTTATATANQEATKEGAGDDKGGDVEGPTIESFDLAQAMPRIAAPGSIVQLSGTGFEPGMVIIVAGLEIKPTVLSSSAAYFTMPEETASSVFYLQAKLGDRQSESLLLAAPPADATADIASIDPSKICAGHAFIAADGDIHLGTATCSTPIPPPPPCASSGDSDCVTAAPFVAVDATLLTPGVIKKGTTIAGVTGDYPSSLSPLTGASSTADLDNLAATIAADSYEWWDSAGARHTGAITDAGAVITPGPADLTFNATVYRGFVVAGDVDLAPENLKVGVDLFGVTGSYPSGSAPLSGESAVTDLVSMTGTTAAGTYEWWDSAGARHAGTVADAGTITPSTATQTFNSSLYRGFSVAGDGDLTAGAVKSGVDIFGITGTYPSVATPLANADATPDLALASFDAQIKSSTAFEWFTADGSRYSNAGDTDIAAGNIATGVTIFGTTGSIPGGGTTVVGTYDTPGDAADVKISGHLAYVADSAGGGLQIIDIAQPASPVLVGSYNSPGEAYALDLYQNYVLLSDEWDLQVIDVSDPTSPILVGTYDPTYYSRGDVMVVGGLAYLGAEFAGVDILSLASPTAPTLLKNVPTPSDSVGVFAVGGYAYSVGRMNGMHIIDISTPASAAVVGTVSIVNNNYRRVAVRGNYAYMSDGPDGFRVVDATTKSSPSLVQTVDTPSFAFDLLIHGPYLYIGDCGAVRVYDISSPSTPSLITAFATPGCAKGMAISPGYLNVADGANGLISIAGLPGL